MNAVSNGNFQGIEGTTRMDRGLIWQRATRFATIVTAAFLLTACATAPLINVETSSLNIPGNVTMEQVEKAIYRGASLRNWSVRKLSPGQLEAKIQVRSHTAVVRILHDTKSFSITYKDSNNLDYDGSSIRRNYNRWILKLRNTIMRETSKLQ